MTTPANATGLEPMTAPSLDHAPSTATTFKALSPKDPASRAIHPGSLPGRQQVTNLDFDVTENCNLGCLYCFKGEMYSRHMSLDMMKRALEWLLDAAGTAPEVNCNFMGGEPLMRWPQIKEFVPWARRRGRARGKLVRFSMTSNLTLFTDEIREFVDQFGFGVLMSIDGCPDVQDAQRPAKNGRPMSQIIEGWARSMLRTRPNATARATIHPDYAHRWFDSFTYLHSIGFREVAVSASEYALWTDAHFEALDEQWSKVVDYVVEQRSRGVEINVGSFKYYVGKLIHARATGHEDDIVFQPQPCGAGKGYLMIDYTGDIWPCHRFDGADTAAGAQGQFRFGNIFEPGFNVELQRSFQDFDHRTMHKRSCDTCPVNPVCGGYCPAANLSDKGSIYTPHDAYCRWSQMVYGHALQMYRRVAELGPSFLDDLVRSCAEAAGTGEK